jgi:hypothetical protein
VGFILLAYIQACFGGLENISVLEGNAGTVVAI